MKKIIIKLIDILLILCIAMGFFITGWVYGSFYGGERAVWEYMEEEWKGKESEIWD